VSGTAIFRADSAVGGHSDHGVAQCRTARRRREWAVANRYADMELLTQAGKSRESTRLGPLGVCETSAREVVHPGATPADGRSHGGHGIPHRAAVLYPQRASAPATHPCGSRSLATAPPRRRRRPQCDSASAWWGRPPRPGLTRLPRRAAKNPRAGRRKPAALPTHGANGTTKICVDGDARRRAG
jgi:hypothetical protein